MLFGIDVGTQQIFNGTLTKITCSAAVPGFRLLRQEMDYEPDEYDQLPDLFDVEARVSPTGDNVTLFINGTNRCNNVTVICIDLTNIAFGQTETLFTLVLEFVSKFIHKSVLLSSLKYRIGILPAPSYVRYNNQNPVRQLQIMWKPPTLFNDEFHSPNVIIDSRITHYVLSITAEDLTIVYYTLETYFSIELQLNNIPCSLSFQVAAVNPAGIGEHSPPQNIDCEFL